MRASALSSSGQAAEALADIEEAIQKDSRNPENYLLRASLHQQLGQAREALDDYGQAIQIAPDSERAYLGRASILRSHGQVQESLDLLSTSPERSGSLSRSSSSLDLSPEVKGTRPRSEDVFEIICNEVVLPLNISLAAVRQFVWRQSAELVMYYRRKSVTQGDDR